MDLLAVAIIAALALTGLVAFVVLVLVRRSRTVGRRSLKSRDSQAVMREARRRLAQNPKDPDALQALASLCYEEQDFEQSRRLYANLIRLCAADASLDEFTFTVRHALSAMHLGDGEEAYKGLMIARTRNEHDFEVNVSLGQLEYQRKNYQRAAALLELALAGDAEHLATRRFLGLALFRLKRFAEAVPHLAFAVDAQPDDKDVVFALAQSYSRTNRAERGLRLFTHLRGDPRLGPASCLSAGLIHYEARRYERAIADFRIGLKHATVPPDIGVELRYRLASTYLKDGALGEAMELWNQIQTTHKDYRDVPDLIGRYREIAANRHLQTYLVSPMPEFVTLCKQVTMSYYADAVTKLAAVNAHRDEYVDVVADVSTARWDDQILFRYLRTADTIGELVLREMYAKIKDLKIGGRGVCLSAGNFTSGAKSFVEARRIDLVGREQLLRTFGKLPTAELA